MRPVVINPTSSSSAEVTDILLRETGTTRLVFRPDMHHNPNNNDASINGLFLFQRKSSKQNWEDTETISLSSLKNGEGYRLALSSTELLTLTQELTGYYELFKNDGIPWVRTEYIQARATAAVKALIELNDDDLTTFLNANNVVGSSLIKRLLAWSTTAQEVSSLVTLLEEVGSDAFSKISSAVSLRALEESLELWESHKTEKAEEFWHKELAQRSFLFQQLFLRPCTIIKDKAYMGGKSYQNTGGGMVDFLVDNGLTSCAALGLFDN